MAYFLKLYAFCMDIRKTSKTQEYHRLKTRNIQLVLLLMASFLPLISQESADIPVITGDDLPHAKISEPRKFTGSSLFGYIDGGAELYLEYGFSEAIITDIETNSRKFKCEVYKMNGTREAFGIYSVSKYRCGSFPSVAEFSCQTKYQLQFCKGPFYISIISMTGSETDSVEMLNLGKIIADKISADEIDLSDYFPDTEMELVKRNVFMAKGRLGIVNGDPDLEDFFMGAKGYIAFILKSPGKSILSVRFLKPEDYNDFLKLHRWNTLPIETDTMVSEQNESIRMLPNNGLFIIL
jgi:hypothetical protein